MNFKKKSYELDCASAMFAFGRTKKRNYNVRLSISLYEKIDKNILEEAFRKTIKKYPYFFVRFVSSKSFFVAEILENIEGVSEKKNFSNFNFQEDRKACEAQVLYSDKTIIFEFFHAISDGKGGIQFLLSLAAEYLSIKYNDKKISSNIEHIPIHEQLEDGYKIHARGLVKEKRRGLTYKIKGTLKPDNTINISSYYLSTEKIKKLAKKHKVSVNAFMSSLLFMALIKAQKENNSNKFKKIRINVPVNLRTRFNCNTMKNFVLSVYPEISSEKDITELPEVCTGVHKYIEKSIDIERLAGRCASSNKLYESTMLKILPIFIKKKLIQFAMNLDFNTSMTFSNLGIISFPTGMEKYISDIEFVFSAKPRTPYSCSMITFNNKTKVTFLRVIKESILELQFEKVLKELGINYSNSKY